MSKTSARYEALEGSLRTLWETLPDVRRAQGKAHPLCGMLEVLNEVIPSLAQVCRLHRSMKRPCLLA
jgi:hypothetical protein